MCFKIGVRLVIPRSAASLFRVVLDMVTLKLHELVEAES